MSFIPPAFLGLVASGGRPGLRLQGALRQSTLCATKKPLTRLSDLLATDDDDLDIDADRHRITGERVVMGCSYIGRADRPSAADVDPLRRAA